MCAAVGRWHCGTACVLWYSVLFTTVKRDTGYCGIYSYINVCKHYCLARSCEDYTQYACSINPPKERYRNCCCPPSLHGESERLHTRGLARRSGRRLRPTPPRDDRTDPRVTARTPRPLGTAIEPRDGGEGGRTLWEAWRAELRTGTGAAQCRQCGRSSFDPRSACISHREFSPSV